MKNQRATCGCLCMSGSDGRRVRNGGKAKEMEGKTEDDWSGDTDAGRGNQSGLCCERERNLWISVSVLQGRRRRILRIEGPLIGRGLGFQCPARGKRRRVLSRHPCRARLSYLGPCASVIMHAHFPAALPPAHLGLPGAYDDIPLQLLFHSILSYISSSASQKLEMAPRLAGVRLWYSGRRGRQGEAS